MEKWKVGVIVLLLAALGGYGFYQQNAASYSGRPSEPEQPKNAPKPNEKLFALQGQAPPVWEFDKQFWVNTPAPISQANTKGQVTLIEFWRMGCPHCREAVPFMNKLFAEYSPRGVKFIAIHSPGAPGPENLENDWEAVRKTIKDWGIKYPVAYDEGGALFKKTYGGDTYPAMLILNRQGKVAYVQSGHTAEKEVALKNALEKTVKGK